MFYLEKDVRVSFRARRMRIIRHESGEQNCSPGMEDAGRILIERRSQGRLRLAILRMRLGVVQTDRDEGIDLRPLAERNGNKAGMLLRSNIRPLL